MNAVGFPQGAALNIPTAIPQGSSFNIPGLGQGSISLGDNETQLANSLISTSGSLLGDTVNNASDLGKSLISTSGSVLGNTVSAAGDLGKKGLSTIGWVIIGVVIAIVVVIVIIVLAVSGVFKKKEGFSTYRKYTRPSRYHDIYEMRRY